MQLVLHIGMPKSGTSSIQRFLKKSKDKLASHGIIYPLISGIGHAHTHLTILDQKNPIPGFLTQIYGSDPDVLYQAGAEILLGLEAELQRTHAEICILSSESWFFRPYLLSEGIFFDFVQRNFSEVKVFCYTRRPSDYFISAFQQSLKSSPDLLPFRAPNFKSVINTCEKVGNVTVVSFETAVKRGITKDFLDRIGADIDIGNEPHENRSFCAEAMILLWEYRHNMPQGRNRIETHEDREFQSRLRKAEEKLGLTTKPELKKPYIEHLDQPTDDLLFLRSRYGIDYARPSRGRSVPAPTSIIDLFEFDQEILDELRSLSSLAL